MQWVIGLRWLMNIGDLVRHKLDTEIGIIVSWEIIYNRFGDPMEKLAVVNWGRGLPQSQEILSLLEVINEKK